MPAQVLDTFKVAAELGPESLSAYVISMATNASDVLAVELLKREASLVVGALPSLLSAPSAGSVAHHSTISLYAWCSILEQPHSGPLAFHVTEWHRRLTETALLMSMQCVLCVGDKASWSC